jgi:hypothetical protein
MAVFLDAGRDGYDKPPGRVAERGSQPGGSTRPNHPTMDQHSACDQHEQASSTAPTRYQHHWLAGLIWTVGQNG